MGREGGVLCMGEQHLGTWRVVDGNSFSSCMLLGVLWYSWRSTARNTPGLLHPAAAAAAAAIMHGRVSCLPALNCCWGIKGTAVWGEGAAFIFKYHRGGGAEARKRHIGVRLGKDGGALGCNMSYIAVFAGSLGHSPAADLSLPTSSAGAAAGPATCSLLLCHCLGGGVGVGATSQQIQCDS
jgi:hypothetical protein